MDIIIVEIDIHDIILGEAIAKQKDGVVMCIPEGYRQEESRVQHQSVTRFLSNPETQEQSPENVRATSAKYKMSRRTTTEMKSRGGQYIHILLLKSYDTTERWGSNSQA